MYALLSWHALFSRHSLVTLFSTLGDQFFLNMQRRGNRLRTFGHHRRPSGRIGKGREASVNHWELSGTAGNLHFDRFFTRFRYQINQIWSYRGLHTTNICEISRSIDSEGGQRLVFHIWLWKIKFLAKNRRKNGEKWWFSDSGLWPGLGGRAKREELTSAVTG